MPQMMPMPWLLMLLIMFTIMMIFMSILYFYPFMSFSKFNFLCMKSKKNNWMW